VAGQAGARPPRARRSPPRPSVRLWLPSQTDFLALVREVSRRSAELAGFDAASAERVALAVDEATTNVIEHAYHGDPGQRMELRFEDLGPELRVDVVDTGARVDPRSFPKVELDAYVAQRRKGGLGVHLMEKIMDSVTFRRSARRNVCCLVKRKGTGSP